jgi:hypothetical protein
MWGPTRQHSGERFGSQRARRLTAILFDGLEQKH